MSLSKLGIITEAGVQLQKTEKNNSVLGLEEIWAEIAKLSTSSILPKLLNPLNTGHDEEIEMSFAENRSKCENSLREILELLKSIVSSEDGKVQTAKRKYVIPLFLFLGEQEDGHKPWSSQENESNVGKIISELFRIFEMDMHGPGPLSAFFFRDFESISNPVKTTFAHILKTFRPTLGEPGAEWKCYPAAQQSFQWLLFQVKYPHLSDHLEGIILPVLNICDDFEIENKLFGIGCISHILDNVVKADFRHSSWALVLHTHMEKWLMFAEEPQLIDKVMPELLKLLKIIEKDPHEFCYKYTLYDKTLKNLLHTVEFTAKPDALNTWLKHLTLYFDVLGFGASHFMVRILRILMDNTTCADPARWMCILKCIRVMVTCAWPTPESDAFAEIMLRIIYNASCLEISPPLTEIQKREVCDTTVNVVHLMEHCSDSESVLKELKEISACEELDPKFRETWKHIFDEVEKLRQV